jgi:peptidyl-dipeptidase Dcp
MSAPETLRRYAIHHQTGAPMPEDLLKRLIAARNFNQGFATVEYTAAALLDLDFHRHAAAERIDPAALERETLARIGMPAEIQVRHRPAHFQHLFAGSSYAAGYYAYLWAETLDADGYEAFTEKGDAFDPDLAARLGAIYRAGDSADPMELYIAFRGRPPRIDALLRQRGLVEEKAS